MSRHIPLLWRERHPWLWVQLGELIFTAFYTAVLAVWFLFGLEIHKVFER